MFKLEAQKIADQLSKYNASYRAGHPTISDEEYDNLTEKLRLLSPEHPYLHSVEPEVIRSGASIRHAQPMISTEKAYTQDALRRYVERVHNAAKGLDITPPLFRVTPKLDGMAGFDRENILASRGNGLVGTEITHIFLRGVIPIGGRNQGAGEIVMVKSFFEKHFAEQFDHPRNVVVGIVNADELGAAQKKALRAGKVHFATYKHLASWIGSGADLIEQIETITSDLAAQVDYPLDGMVAEAIDEKLKKEMGATTHHHRWQIAIKSKGETAITSILDVGWQTGRTGAITPVLRVEPTKVSGATISNITAHHAGMVRDKQLGKGAQITIIRSGEVIPKLESVLKPSNEVHIPTECPSCGGEVNWDNDFLRCINSSGCPAQTETGLRHWFKTLGTANGFGPSTLSVLVKNEYTSLEDIYNMTADDFIRLGFGEKQSENLEEALGVSINTSVEDARFLAAFGLPHLGIGESRRLLRNHPLTSINTVTTKQLEDINGFGSKTSPAIVEAISNQWPTISHMTNLNFNLVPTPLEAEFESIQSPIAGVTIMFTGEMQTGNRKEMQENARNLGAKVLTGVSKKLSVLVIGLAPSASKISKAEKNKVRVIEEAAYLEILTGKATF